MNVPLGLLASLALALTLGANAARVVAAEATTGAIVGAILDENGNGIPNVRISAVLPSGRHSVGSGTRGRFVLLGLVPDVYTVSAQANGYESAVRSDVR